MSIKSLMGLFITSVSLIQIFTIYVGVYLNASPLQHQLMWWMCDIVIIAFIWFSFTLALLYFTIPVDHCSPEKSFLNMQGQLVFFSQLHYITRGGIINKLATLNLKKPIPSQHPSQPVKPCINSFYPKMKHFGRLSIIKDTVLLSPPFLPAH